MTGSPKRKTEDRDEHFDQASKRPRVSGDGAPTTDVVAAGVPVQAPADSRIDHAAAIAYWSTAEPTINGVLGGYPQLSRVDLQGSSNFLAKLRRTSKHHPTGVRLKRVVDCGAGIGRVTDGFLSKIAEVVDIVEPVKALMNKTKAANVGTIYNVGLQQWFPDREGLGPYDVIWNQWCVGQLTDAQLVEYLKRLPAALSEGGWIVVKENLSINYKGEDDFDEVDSTVTRTDEKFRKLFQEAGCNVLATEVQKGFPKVLYPVRMYALQPR